MYGYLSKERIYPPERDVSDEKLKVGVFMCHCGANIGRVVDVPSTVKYALRSPHVVHAPEQLFSCATNFAKEMRENPLSTGEISETLGLNPSEVSKLMKNSVRHGVVRYDENKKCFTHA